MKEFEDDDPMELQGICLPGGDPEVEAKCLIEEFLMMGMKGPDVSELFSNPYYFGAYRLSRILGKEKIQNLIDGVTLAFSRSVR